jgi:hypothetical protein
MDEETDRVKARRLIAEHCDPQAARELLHMRLTQDPTTSTSPVTTAQQAMALATPPIARCLSRAAGQCSSCPTDLVALAWSV